MRFKRFVAILKDGKLIIQKSDYIEDGWYIEIEGNKFHVYEIPEGGGKEQLFGTYNHIEDAVDSALNLT